MSVVILVRKHTGPCFVPEPPHVPRAGLGLFLPPAITGLSALFNSLLKMGDLSTKTHMPVLRTRITACGSILDQAPCDCARVIAAGTTSAHASTWSTLSGYQCSGGSLGGQQLSLAAAKRACVDSPRCSGVNDVSGDGRKGFALCDASRALKNLAPCPSTCKGRCWYKGKCRQVRSATCLQSNYVQAGSVWCGTGTTATAVPAGSCVHELVVRVPGDSCHPQPNTARHLPVLLLGSWAGA